MSKVFKSTALALAASSVALTAVPAEAQSRYGDRYGQYEGYGQYGDRYDTRYGQRYPTSEPVYRDTRVWEGQDGQYYCRKKDGTTGLIIGGAAGALIGREVLRGDRTLGTILGGAAGALLGKRIAQGSSSRCR